MKKPESISFEHVALPPAFDPAHLEQLRQSGFYSSDDESEHGPAAK